LHGLLVHGLRAARFWRWLLLGLVVVVGWLALQPRPPASINLGWDKLNHAAAFAALAFAAWLGHAASWRQRGVALLALWAYGGLIEVAQTWLPPRQGDWADLLGDTVGLAVGTALAAGILRLLMPGDVAGPQAQREGPAPRS
jgi:VanZ family protein